LFLFIFVNVVILQRWGVVLNNEIAINTKEQTAVHHSNRPVALASMTI